MIHSEAGFKKEKSAVQSRLKCQRPNARL